MALSDGGHFLSQGRKNRRNYATSGTWIERELASDGHQQLRNLDRAWAKIKAGREAEADTAGP
jgi:hypothetical protein